MPTGPSEPWRGSGLLLVVDDEDTVRLMTARALEYFGFRVLTAADGRKGVDLFAAHRDEVRAVLLDMTMPQLNGEAALAEIRALRADARVLLMTGYSEADASERFDGRGLSGFVQKPFDLETLGATVRRVLGE